MKSPVHRWAGGTGRGRSDTWLQVSLRQHPPSRLSVYKQLTYWSISGSGSGIKMVEGHIKDDRVFNFFEVILQSIRSVEEFL